MMPFFQSDGTIPVRHLLFTVYTVRDFNFRWAKLLSAEC